MFKFFKTLLDVFIPPRCLLCGKLVDKHTGLCPECFSEIHFIGPNVCPICGHPHFFDTETGRCPLCINKHPPFDKVQSAFYYDEFSKHLILPFKHADRTDMAAFLSVLLSQIGTSLIESADMIIPVPLHPKRLRYRKYNQSALLALHLAKKSHKTYEPMLLKRTRDTPSQENKTYAQRAKNVKNAFSVSNPDKIQGKTILLIDDVFTTGATLASCALTLKKAGAEKVYCLTLARTRQI